MSRPKAVHIPLNEKDLWSEPEVLGFLTVTYETFKKNYLDAGLTFWKQVGGVKFYKSVDIYKFIDEKGQDPSPDVVPISKGQRLELLAMYRRGSRKKTSR